MKGKSELVLLSRLEPKKPSASASGPDKISLDPKCDETEGIRKKREQHAASRDGERDSSMSDWAVKKDRRQLSQQKSKDPELEIEPKTTGNFGEKLAQ